MSLGKSKLSGETPISSADVEAFLQQHQDFFQNHLELLESLNIPHPTGDAVSLITRQVEVLRDKNRKLQVQLNEILQIARDNDALHHRSHQLTLAILNAASLEDALASLKWGLHEYFQADFVAVRIIHPNLSVPIADLGLESGTKAIALFGDIFEAGAPICGKPNPDQARFLFGRDGPEILSYALVPLQHAGLRGLLSIGSKNAEHFHPAMGSLFIAQMGEIVSARFATFINPQN